MTHHAFTDELARMTERIAVLHDEATRLHAPLLDRALVEVGTSIEELHAAEEELREQNDRLAALNLSLELERRRYADLFDNAPVGYIVTDASGNITDINRAASEMVGAERGVLLDKPFNVLVERAERGRWTGMLARVRDSRGCEPQVLMLGRVGNARMRCRITGAAEVDESGTPRLCRWIIEDFDALELAANAQQMVLEAQRKDEFLAMLGHELRNPLAPIRAAVERTRGC
jgi:PAS domain S-box-containing protein